MSHGRCSGVNNVVGARESVAVGVLAEDGPRQGDELEGADGMVPDRVTVEATGVSVGDGRRAVCAIECDADDGRCDIAAGRDSGAAVAAEAGLNLGDPGEDLPGEPDTGRDRGAVDVEQAGRDVVNGILGGVEPGVAGGSAAARYGSCRDDSQPEQGDKRESENERASDDGLSDHDRSSQATRQPSASSTIVAM